MREQIEPAQVQAQVEAQVSIVHTQVKDEPGYITPGELMADLTGDNNSNQREEMMLTNDLHVTRMMTSRPTDKTDTGVDIQTDSKSKPRSKS